MPIEIADRMGGYDVYSSNKRSAELLEALAPAVGTHLMVFAALDPAAAEDRIVLRMHGIGEHDYVIRAFIFLQVFVLGEKRALGLSVDLVGDELGFVDEPKAMQ